MRLPRSKPGSPLHIRPFEADCAMRRITGMNLTLRVIEDGFGPKHTNTCFCNLHPDPSADCVLASSPFNKPNWFSKDDAVCGEFGVPPKRNANFAWVPPIDSIC
jgi:type I restriction enzyme M protein